jgi:hypothetical protein
VRNRKLWATGVLVPFAAAAPILCVVLAGQTPGGPGLVTIEVPPWVRGGACLIAGKSVQVRTAGERTAIDVACTKPSGVMSCDLDNAEPLDALLSDICTARQLAVERSRPVAIVAETPTAVRVEWLALGPDGRFEIRATRDTNLDARDPQRLAVASGRFLRLTPINGRSPVTVPADGLRAETPWTMLVASGGEVLIGLEQATVLPARFLIEGTDERASRVESRVASFVGLTPGQQVLTPEYAGGVRGEPFRVTVTAGASMTLAAPAADVGAVRVIANQTACEATAEMRLAGRVKDLTGQLVRGQFVVVPHEGQCDRFVAGLQPGQYAVWLGTASNSYTRADVAVDRQQVTEVPLQARAVTLSGRVLLNGRPASGVQIQLRKTSGGANGRWEVREGQYSATSGEPGEYVATLASLRSGSAVIERRTLTLEEGANYADWSAQAAVLRVDLRNWDRAAPVSVTARRKMTDADRARMEEVAKVEGTANFPLGFSVLIRPEDTLPLHVALPFSDSYVVQASQREPRQLIAPPVQVSLTKTQPDRDIVLDLADETRTLTLVDERGSPVAGAAITLVPAKEVSPGVFELTARPGAKILIRAPGFPLACRVAPEDRVVPVVLRRGRPLDVHFVGQAPTVDAKILPAGSDCEVHLLALDHVALADAGDGITRLRFSSFPAEPTVAIRLLYEGPVLRVDVPATGPLVVKSGG